jgi:hypothetical protein
LGSPQRHAHLDYTERLDGAGGHLFLSGVDPRLLDQLSSANRVGVDEQVTVVPALASGRGGLQTSRD